MRLKNEEKERIIRFFEEEIDPIEFAQIMGVFLHEVLLLNFEAQEREVSFTINPKTMVEGYYYLITLFGQLDPQRDIYKLIL